MSVVDCWVEVDTGVKETWQIVRNFIHNDSWMLPQEQSFITVTAEKSDQPVRTYETERGEITEKLLSIDDFDYVVRYAIEKSFLPLKTFRGSLSVSDNNDGTSSVFWRVEYESDEDQSVSVSEHFEQFFEEALARLKEQLAFQGD